MRKNVPYNDFDFAEAEIKVVADHQRRKGKYRRNSIEWHKKRLMARMTPKVDYQQISIHQAAHNINDGYSRLLIGVAPKHPNTGDDRYSEIFHLKRYPVQENYRIVRALNYLVTEGKLQVDIPLKEWRIQLALGTAVGRKFSLNNE